MSPRREVCDRRRLDLFLHNQLPEESQRDLEAHLDYCPACRDNLDKLAGGKPWQERILIICRAEFDRHVLPRDVTGFGEALTEGDGSGRVRVRSRWS